MAIDGTGQGPDSRNWQRQQGIRAREQLSGEQRLAYSQRIVQRILASPEFQSARTILSYRAVKGEVSLDGLDGAVGVVGVDGLDGMSEAADRLGKRIVYPRCVSRTEMIALFPAVAIRRGTGTASRQGADDTDGRQGADDTDSRQAADGWQVGSFGILEPDPEKSALIAPDEIDLVLCPCTAFDEHGQRIGMGAGYYDRYLPQCSKASIAAVAFEAQKAERVLAEDWDYPMPLIFTEAATYRN